MRASLMVTAGLTLVANVAGKLAEWSNQAGVCMSEER